MSRPPAAGIARTKRLLCWIAPFLAAAILCSSCTDEYAGIPKGAARHSYRELLEDLPERAYTEGSTVSSFYYQGPGPHSAATIKTDAGNILLTADAGGVVDIPVADALFLENPDVFLMTMPGPPGGAKPEAPAERHWGPLLCTISLSDGRLPVRGVVLEDLDRLNGDGYTVFYEKACEDAARTGLKDMARFAKLISRVCGLKTPPLGLAVLKDRTNFYTPSLGIDYPVWSFTEPQVRRTDVIDYAAILVHEWTERSLHKFVADRGNLTTFDNDHRLRFISDGIADYVASLASQRILAFARMELETFVEKKGPVKVNVIDFGSAGTSLAYRLSLLFWHSLTARHGDDVIAKFLVAWKRSGRLDLPSAIARLREITGDPTIQAQLEGIDVEDALATVRKIVPTDALPDVRRIRAVFLCVERARRK